MNRYEPIRDEMIRRVNSGEWKVGTDLPHETDLAEEFGVARGTVRRALSSLVEQGLVQRRRRAGSRVVARTSHASRMTIPIVREEIERRGQAYSYLLLEIEHRPGQPDFGAAAGVLAVRCLHLADQQPFQLEDRVINLDALPEAKLQDFDRASPNEWLVSVVPATEVVTTISADGADAALASDLRLAPGAPVLVLSRRTSLDGVPLTRVRMSHPAASFQIVTRSS